VLKECIALLSHGDSTYLLGELSPPPAWLPTLVDKRVFDRVDASPGLWITARINDSDMIRACAAIAKLDDETRRHIERAVERERATLTPSQLKAWQLILASKRASPTSYWDDNWYLAAGKIKSGETGFDARRLVSLILRPFLVTSRVYSWHREERGEGETEQVHHLVSIDFKAGEHPPASEILGAWPKTIDHEIPLFHTLNRALLDLLEEAADAGFLEYRDRASGDIPSVANHPQNAYHQVFYPITRALADLWQRIVGRDPDRARAIALAWSDFPYLLTRRLWLYVLKDQVFTAKEATTALFRLEDDVFWVSDAQVEIMGLMFSRWKEFDEADRRNLEIRLCQGMPRAIFSQDAFEDIEEWTSILDSSRYRRLQRIAAASEGELSVESLDLLAEISARHPKWKPGAGDRDDFHTWMEGGTHGPDGHPDLLSSVEDVALVREAMRLQREQHFEEADVWRLFCSADPDRALRGLKLAGDANEWEPYAWRSLIQIAVEKGEIDFQFELTDQILRMPNPPLIAILPSVAGFENAGSCCRRPSAAS